MCIPCDGDYVVMMVEKHLCVYQVMVMIMTMMMISVDDHLHVDEDEAGDGGDVIVKIEF